MEHDLQTVLDGLDKAAETRGGLKAVAEASDTLYQTIYCLRRDKKASPRTLQRLATYFRKEAKKRERRALKEAK